MNRWRFRAAYGTPAHFVLLFDASKVRVRGTRILPWYPPRRGSLY